MANDLMPATGFVRTVDPGEPANVEEVKEDINFLHQKFDNDPLLGGHNHSGAGKGALIGLDGLKQEVIDNMGGFPVCRVKAIKVSYNNVSAQYRIEVDGDTTATNIAPPLFPQARYLGHIQGANIAIPLKALISLRVYISGNLSLNVHGEAYLFSILITNTDGNAENPNTVTAQINYGVPF